MNDGDVARLAVLVSGAGTNLQALIDAAAADRGPDGEADGLGGEVVVVASDQPAAGGLDRAADAGIPTVVEPVGDHPDRTRWEKALIAGLREHVPDVVVLAGFMRLVSGTFLSQWPGRVLNVHPSLLPAFRGARAVRDALDYGVKVTGVTVHLVDEKVDHGPIVAQRAVPVEPGDTVARLHGRIQTAEHDLLPRCVSLLCHGRLQVDGRHVTAGG